MSAIRTAPFELNILSQALPASKLFFQDLGFPQQANLVLVSGTGGPLTVTYTDENGQTSPPITIQAGASYYTQNLVIRILTITGPAGATFAGAITWPRVVDPSDIVVSSISGKVSTSIDGQTVGVAPADTYAGTAIAPSLQDQLPASLDSNGFFQTRYLGGSDIPGRGWTLGSGDVPNRGWTLGSSDVPNRGWTLGGTDTPSRSWTLGTTDTPTAYGSAGKALQQDSLGNQYHVPVLQGTSTPINTKALQYDTNNYPLHSIGNTLAGGAGGDKVVGGSYFYNGTGASGNNGNQTVYTAESGYRVLLDAISLIVVNNSTTDSSSKVSFTNIHMALSQYGLSTAGGTYYPYTDTISDTAAYYVGTTTNSALVETFYTSPQNLDPSVGGLSSVAYYNKNSPANNGPASGDITIVNVPLTLLPGDTLSVVLEWSGGTSATNFLAYFYLHGHTEVL